MVSSDRQRLHIRLLLVVGMLLCGATTTAAAEAPETVVITYQVKADAAADLLHVISEHWRVARQMHLVRPSPHVVVQGGDKGKGYIVEVLTWRDGSVPDNAPDAITRLWQEMTQFVEVRDGRPGIDISPVKVLMQ